jgi:hypothetical protein
VRAGSAPSLQPKAPRLREAWVTPVALALALAPSFVHADYKQDYAHALEAYKAGRFAEAQTLFTQAAAEHPEPAERTKLYGMRFEPYLPQHYLGLIAAQTGDCGRARAQWGAAGNAEVVAKIGDAAAEEQSASAKCGGAIAQSKPAAPPPPAQAPAPGPASAPVAATPQKPAPSEPSKPVVAAPPPPTVAVVSKPNEPASKPAAEAPTEKPAPDKVAPPDQLLAAFDGFLNGRLSDVARINPDAYADARARYHAYLVRSGARYTLAQLNGDQGLLESARADARAAKTLNAGATPDAVLFSPRFRDFYRDTR